MKINFIIAIIIAIISMSCNVVQPVSYESRFITGSFGDCEIDSSSGMYTYTIRCDDRIIGGKMKLRIPPNGAGVMGWIDEDESQATDCDCGLLFGNGDCLAGGGRSLDEPCLD